MDGSQVALIIGGMALVTYIPRLIPMLALSGKQLPQVVARWLGYVPAAVMGALLCSSLALKPNELSVGGFDVRTVLTVIPTGFVAIRYRNILLTVVVGVVVAGVLRQVMQ